MRTALSRILRPAGLVTAVTLGLTLPGIAQEAPAPAAPPLVQPVAPSLVAPALDAPSLDAPALPVEAAPILPAEAEQAPARPPVAAPVADVQTAATAAVAPTPAPMAAPMAAPVAAPHPDYSPWGMYLAAHWVVKAVMIALVFASFVTWTVLFYKLIELAVARSRARRSVRTIQAADTLEAASDQLATRRDPAAFMARAALVEYRRSDSAIAVAGSEGVKERTRSVLSRVEVQAGSRIRRGTGVLATIGATAPFVGLFGTVWGIMNSFIGIAETKTTNLAVVAPGIAEALLATAIGLVAAIPAVVIYNHFSREIASYRQSLGDAAAGVERLLSRDLDFQRAGRAGV
ncbi:MAG: tonB-system energizer ExbB [Pseudomonadota bacterium]